MRRHASAPRPTAAVETRHNLPALLTSFIGFANETPDVTTDNASGATHAERIRLALHARALMLGGLMLGGPAVRTREDAAASRALCQASIDVWRASATRSDWRRPWSSVERGRAMNVTELIAHALGEAWRTRYRENLCCHEIWRAAAEP